VYRNIFVVIVLISNCRKNNSISSLKSTKAVQLLCGANRYDYSRGLQFYIYRSPPDSYQTTRLVSIID